jgi:hypothetical protein
MFERTAFERQRHFLPDCISRQGILKLEHLNEQYLNTGGI